MVEISEQDLDNRRLAAIEAYRKKGDSKSLIEADLLEVCHLEQLELRKEWERREQRYVAAHRKGEPCIFRFPNKQEYSCEICEQQDEKRMLRDG